MTITTCVNNTIGTDYLSIEDMNGNILYKFNDTHYTNSQQYYEMSLIQDIKLGGSGGNEPEGEDIDPQPEDTQPEDPEIEDERVEL